MSVGDRGISGYLWEAGLQMILISFFCAFPCVEFSKKEGGRSWQQWWDISLGPGDLGEMASSLGTSWKPHPQKSPFHTDSGLAHVSQSGQWDFSKHETDGGLKTSCVLGLYCQEELFLCHADTSGGWDTMWWEVPDNLAIPAMPCDPSDIQVRF